jgi:hypothetical protein
MSQGGAQDPKTMIARMVEFSPKFGEKPATQAQRHGKSPGIGQSKTKIYRSSTWMIAASIKIKTFSPR